MAENKLPNGVGKKIVQALKKQAEIEIKAVSDEAADDFSQEPMISEDTFESETVQEPVIDDNFSDFNSQNDYFSEPEPISINNFDSDPVEVPNSFDSIDDFGFSSDESSDFVTDNAFPSEAPRQNRKPQAQNHSMPSNVAVLKRLISQLPGGVTKQTGAQIIRQTMEAIGISMSSVLKEAQQVQDSLNDSARSCMSSIQEYKNNIRSLEKQMQDYKKQAVALNDLISLFVLTDKR